MWLKWLSRVSVTLGRTVQLSLLVSNWMQCSECLTMYVCTYMYVWWYSVNLLAALMGLTSRLQCAGGMGDGYCELVEQFSAVRCHCNVFARVTAFVTHRTHRGCLDSPLYYGEFAVTVEQTAVSGQLAVHPAVLCLHKVSTWAALHIQATGRDLWYSAHASHIREQGCAITWSDAICVDCDRAFSLRLQLTHNFVRWAASVWSDGGGHLLFNYDNLTWNDDILKALMKN